jgi:hypothetical protein
MDRARHLAMAGPAAVASVRVPTHRVGPAETLSLVEYGDLIGAPDRRSAYCGSADDRGGSFAPQRVGQAPDPAAGLDERILDLATLRTLRGIGRIRVPTNVEANRRRPIVG